MCKNYGLTFSGICVIIYLNLISAKELKMPITFTPPRSKTAGTSHYIHCRQCKSALNPFTRVKGGFCSTTCRNTYLAKAQKDARRDALETSMVWEWAEEHMEYAEGRSSWRDEVYTAYLEATGDCVSMSRFSTMLREWMLQSANVPTTREYRATSRGRATWPHFILKD